MKILVIEDDGDTLAFVKMRLEQHCFTVDIADDGNKGLHLARMNDYDLIVLDYALPGRNGYQIVENLRKFDRNVPVIMISVTQELDHKLQGFEYGIDDYVVKPFFFDELLARIQAILRRPQQQVSSTFIFDDLTLDTDRQVVTRGDMSIRLTRKEFSLLEYLMRNPKTVVSRGSLVEHVWDMSIDPFSNAIETHVFNLRKKIDSKSNKPLIHSIPGRGYKIDTVK